MSARRVFRRKVMAMEEVKLKKRFDEIRVRSFDDAEDMQVLKLDSVPMQDKLDEFLHGEIINMKKLAAHKTVSYLTDSQYNKTTWRVFVINKNLVRDQWTHPDYKKWQDFTAYINPTIQRFLTDPRTQTQECLSFPFIKAICDRSSEIQVKYFTTKNEIKFSNEDEKVPCQQVNQKLEGFKALVFQHCLDHLQGKCFFHPEVSRGRLQMDQFQDQYERTKFLLREMNIRMKDGLENKKINDEKFKKTMADYEQRIAKSFREESMEFQLFYQNMAKMDPNFKNKF